MRSFLFLTALFALIILGVLGGCGLPEITDAGSGCLYDYDAGPLCVRPPVEAGPRPDAGADADAARPDGALDASKDGALLDGGLEDADAGDALTD